jgi:hypothetical protein
MSIDPGMQNAGSLPLSEPLADVAVPGVALPSAEPPLSTSGPEGGDVASSGEDFDR